MKDPEYTTDTACAYELILLDEALKERQFPKYRRRPYQSHTVTNLASNIKSSVHIRIEMLQKLAAFARAGWLYLGVLGYERLERDKV